MKIEGRENLFIGQVQGCPVTASYMDDGQLYSAAMTWQEHTIETDGRDYINLFGSKSGGGCVGDIGINQWRIIRDLVQCDAIEQLTDLALAHQWIAPIDGYVPEDELPELVPAAPIVRAPLPTLEDFQRDSPRATAAAAAYVDQILALLREERAERQA